ncbi:hypothetical protein EYF80_010815 [Liparis tanakae]|uniref:Uncharacterized protein n=1 Tax=Liparis tanakae TaxID=230148 RepID=A0A4Z2ILI0_9TELE|nr:hypothetical protein EYF80_010815 [Liparis tanakae]
MLVLKTLLPDKWIPLRFGERRKERERELKKRRHLEKREEEERKARGQGRQKASDPRVIERQCHQINSHRVGRCFPGNRAWKMSRRMGQSD